MKENIYELKDKTSIRTVSEPFCHRCSKPVEGYTYCSDCYKKCDILKINAIGLYLKSHEDVPNSTAICSDYPTNKAVLKLKNYPSYAEVLGECMVSMIESEYQILKKFELIVPVPEGTPERGFNQAALLAKYISDHIGIVYKDILLDKGKKYVFSWDEIPGKGSVRLINFLTQKFSIGWAITAKIEKIDDGKTIKVSTEKNSLSLRLNDKKTEVILEIDDSRTGNFMAETENNELKIYAKKQPQHMTSYEEKEENVKDTIECIEDVGGRSVLLIDDVCTSGFTLKECASVLKKHGAGEIREIVFAKEVSIKHLEFINQKDKYL